MDSSLRSEKKENSSDAQTGLVSLVELYEKLLSTRPGSLASESGGELAWMGKARERAAGRWKSLGLPTRKSERWHYTSLNLIEKAQFRLPSIPEEFQTPNANEIITENGIFQNSSLGDLPGVKITTLSRVFEECVRAGWSAERRESFSAFQKHLETSDIEKETAFAALNTSFMLDAVLISVSPGVIVREPIVIRHHFSRSTESGMTLVSPRVFVDLGRGAEATLLEVSTGGDGVEYFSNSVTDLRLDAAAKLRYSRLQNEGDQGIHMSATRVHQGRDSRLENLQFDVGGKLARHDLHVGLEGEGAEAILDGLYLVNGSQHVDNYTLIDHAVAHTTSAQLYKGILDGEARAVFNGHVRIQRYAQKSNASQANNNLMLSRKAEVDTKPELEIDADDVKAAHGATVGQIDPEHVFYLESRAIPRCEAIRMLAEGFARDVISRSDKSIQGRLSEALTARFKSFDFRSLQ